MVKKITDHLTANKELFESTVLFITMDEGGGYYDSGYIQPIDFFGDGPRIPLIAVSPFTRGGHISQARMISSYNRILALKSRLG